MANEAESANREGQASESAHSVGQSQTQGLSPAREPCECVRFYELCYSQYRFELEEAERIYQKGAIMLIVLPVLLAAVFKFARIDLFPDLIKRIDVLLYYLCVVVSVAALGLSIVYTFRALCPRSDYQRLGAMMNWEQWRLDMERWNKEKKSQETRFDDVLIQKLCPKLAEAQSKNAPLNEKRRKHFQKAVYFTGASLATISLEASFYLLLKLQGV